MFRNNRLYEAGGEGTGGAAKIDLTTKVKGADGKEYTVGDLLNVQTSLSQLQAKIDSMTQFQKDVAAVFAPNTEEGVRDESMRRVLVASGYTEEQAEEYMGATDAIAAGITGGGEGDGEGEGDDDVTNEAVNKIAGEVEGLRKDQRDANRKRLEERLQAVVTEIVDKDPNYKALLEGVERKHGEKDGPGKREKLRNTLVNQLDTKIREGLHSRNARGEQFNEGWFEEEAKKATAPVLEPFQSVISDFSSLGRSPETVTEDPILKKEPVKAPDFKPGVERSDLEKQAGDWLKDSLVRDAATIGSD